MSQKRVGFDLRMYRCNAALSKLQMLKTLTLAALSGALLSACQQPAQTSGQKSNTRRTHAEVTDVQQAAFPAVSQTAASLTLETKLKKGMAYAELRKVAIDAGWKPVIDSECKSNVIGANYVELCSAHPELDDCRVCADLPELGSCSGDGYCGMTFSHNTRTFDITTYGMIEDRAVMGNESRLQVMGWKFSNQKNP